MSLISVIFFFGGECCPWDSFLLFGEVTLFSLHGIVDLHVFPLLKTITYGLTTVHTFLNNADVNVFMGSFCSFQHRTISSLFHYGYCLIFQTLLAWIELYVVFESSVRGSLYCVGSKTLLWNGKRFSLQCVCLCRTKYVHRSRLSVLLLVLVHLPKEFFFHLFSLYELKYSSATGYQEEISLLPQVFHFLQAVNMQNCTSSYLKPVFNWLVVPIQHQDSYFIQKIDITMFWIAVGQQNKWIITTIVKFLTGLLLIPKVFYVCSVSEQSPPFCIFFKECVKTHQSLWIIKVYGLC